MKTSTLSVDSPAGLSLAAAESRRERSIRPMLGLASTALILLVGLRSHYMPAVPHMAWVLWLCYGALVFTQIFGWASLLSEHPHRMVSRAGGNQRDVLAGPGYDLRPAVSRARHMALGAFAFAVVTFLAFAWVNYPLPLGLGR